MAHWQLGEKDKARKWHDRAIQSMRSVVKSDPIKAYKLHEEELRILRAEAAALLGLPADDGPGPGRSRKPGFGPGRNETTLRPGRPG